jgi:acetyltransferase-like isoleucine patch superfamily enzyme
MSGIALREWVKARETPLARAAYALVAALRGARMPVIRPLHRALYAGHLALAGFVAELGRVLWWTPLFVSRLETPAPGLRLYSGMPQVLGPLRIQVGRDCRISGRSTFIGRAGGVPGGGAPLLRIGDNVDIGWMSALSIGTRIEIGDNARLAGRCLLAGFPGHPMDPADRAAGLPDTPDQLGDIVLERDVWLATGVTVLAGVRIGAGTVVAAGSVVTRDLPAGVLAAGVPARIIRPLQVPPPATP